MQVRWNLEHVYFYLVSFIALILILVGAINLTRTAIAYVAPTDHYYSPFYEVEPFFDYNDWEEAFGPELIAAEKERAERINKENYSRSLIRDLVSSITFILIALPVYLYHWRKIPSLEKDV